MGAPKMLLLLPRYCCCWLLCYWSFQTKERRGRVNRVSFVWQSASPKCSSSSLSQIACKIFWIILQGICNVRSSLYRRNFLLLLSPSHHPRIPTHHLDLCKQQNLFSLSSSPTVSIHSLPGSLSSFRFHNMRVLVDDDGVYLEQLPQVVQSWFAVDEFKCVVVVVVEGELLNQSV